MADQPAAPPSASDDEKELARNRTTFLLMIGGAISLLIPLIGVGYMHYRDLRAQASAASAATAVFEHRADDPSSAALTPAATPAPDGPAGNRLAQVPNMAPRDSSPAPVQPNMASQQGGSLSFIRANSDYTGQQQQTAAAAAPPQQQAAPQPQAPQPQAQAQAQASVANLQQKKPAKPVYKPFNVPHLKPSAFGGQQMAGPPGQQQPPGGQGMPGGGNPMAAMQQMMGGQGGAGGAGGAGGNPMAAMQQMMGGQGGAGGAGGAGGMPNMGAMMQQMGGAGAGGGGAGGMPNMGAMMQQMQQQQGQQH